MKKKYLKVFNVNHCHLHSYFLTSGNVQILVGTAEKSLVVCVCVYVCVCVHACVCVRVCIYVWCMYICMYICIVCVYVCVCVYIYVCVCVCVYVCVYLNRTTFHQYTH